MDAELTRALERAEARASKRFDMLVGSLIDVWRQAFPDGDPLTALKCSTLQLTQLSLCARPRSSTWLEDVVEIAQVVAIDPRLLESFVRACEVAERLANAHGATGTS